MTFTIVSIDRDGNRTRTSIPVSSILGFEDAYFRAAALVPEGDAIHAYALGPDPENPAEEIALVVAARGGAQQ